MQWQHKNVMTGEEVVSSEEAPFAGANYQYI